MKDRKFIEGFLWGFVITSTIFCTVFAYVIGELVK
jgi:hypothetical protein